MISRTGVIGAMVLGGGGAVAALVWILASRIEPETAPSQAEQVADVTQAVEPAPRADLGDPPPATEINDAADRNVAAPDAKAEELARAAPADGGLPPAGSPSEQTAADAPAPRFDIVRVDSDGQTVIAGRTAPNESVDVMLDGEVVETVLADATGRFVAIVTADVAAEPRELRLRVTLPDPPRRPAGQRAPDGSARGPAAEAPNSPAAASSAPPSAIGGQASRGDRPVATAPAGEAAGRSEADDDGALPAPPGERRPAAVDRPSDGHTDGARDVAALSAAPDPAEAEAQSGATGNAGETPRRAPSSSAGTVQKGQDSAPMIPPGASEGEPRQLLSEPVLILPGGRADEAPALVQPRREELAMLQHGGAEAEAVVLDQLTQAPDGRVQLRGRAQPGHSVRIYANGQPIETAPVRDGGWSATIPRAQAETLELLRFDEIGRAGQVTSRIEMPFEPSGATERVVRDRSITVQRGDNLWRIAEQHYGDGIRYSVIFGANSDLIRDPDLIYPDQVFTIPELVEAE